LKKNYIYGVGWDRNLYRHTYNMNNQNWDKVTGQDKNDDIFSFDVGHNHIYAIRDTSKIMQHIATYFLMIQVWHFYRYTPC